MPSRTDPFVRRPPRWPLLAAFALAFSPGQVVAVEPDAEGLAFFEKKIRPVLVTHCYECHSTSSKEVKGHLLLDSREASLQGGDTGPAVVPGDPEKSLLIEAIRYGEDSYQMPPKGKLPESVIADFVRWIELGAPDPRTAPVAAVPKRAAIDVEAGRAFWSFQPIRDAVPPDVRRIDWPRNEIDRFILAPLEKRNLAPVADADRRTLLRRLSFDLVGLPPTPHELDAFERDDSPDALARAADRLLASPRFGERWGRHWLDVARYADSNGLDENLTYHHAWRYRDYVIASFNGDKPFDQFAREQLAGDLLPADDAAHRDERLVATGFLVLGPKVLAERDKEKLRMDVVDEQIDTVGRAFLGLALGCARCHDHKFDPIPTADYYALAGIFNSTETLSGNKLGNVAVSGWKERPLSLAPDHAAAIAAHEASVGKLEGELKGAKAELTRLQGLAKGGPASPVAAAKARQLVGIVVDDTSARIEGAWKASTFHPNFVGQGYLHDDQQGKGQKSIIFEPHLPQLGEYEIRISYTPGNGRSRRVPVTVNYADGVQRIEFDQVKAPPIDGLFASIGTFRFEAGREGSVTISTEGTEGFYVIADAVQFIPVDQPDATSGVADKKPAPANPPDAQPLPTESPSIGPDQLAAAEKAVAAIESELAELKKGAPPPPPAALAVGEQKEPADCRICIRGEVHNRGPAVPRGFVQVAARARPEISPGESGRRQLADWIADPGNPLTARVAVNRIWQKLFGEGLVRSVDEFGTRGEPPSHPELLDYLAARFLAHDWSVKDAIRHMVLSRAYGLSTAANQANQAADPENRLLGRAHRKRLDAEALRDAILLAAGQLEFSQRGSMVADLPERAIDNNSRGGLQLPDSRRRSVYLPVIRNEVAEIFEVFDFVDPHVSTGRRGETNVPAQALFLMNSPWVVRHAEAAADRLLALEGLRDADRVERAYLVILGRRPADDEEQAALAFLESYAGRLVAHEPNPDKRRRAALAGFCQALLASTEFRYME
jgi:hypothetical protein